MRVVPAALRFGNRARAHLAQLRPNFRCGKAWSLVIAGQAVVEKSKMSECFNAELGRLGAQLLDRRRLLIGVAALVSSSAFAQTDTPKLIVLPKGVTSPVRFNERSPKDPNKFIQLTNISLEGCLVCNGAAASRADYKELFQVFGTRFGPGDGKSTFNVPKYPLQYRSGHLVGGMAICPSSRLALPVGAVVPFDAHDLLAADPSQKPQ